MLNTLVSGDEGAPPLLIAHGLFGSARNWGAVQKRLSDTYRVTAADMRNHGDSPWEDAHDYPSMADDLAALLDAPSFVLGHSMGGKAAMALALRHPDLVAGLIVADIAPVTYEHTQTHLIDAMRTLDLSAIESRREADAQLSAQIDEPGVRAFLLQSLDVPGKRWKLNLDVLEREMPKIIGWPEIDAQFDGPTLFLSGAKSDYVLPEYRERARALFPNARFAEIKDAGHWLHAEKPRDVETTVRGFFGDITRMPSDHRV
ncbi:pimeloyl-ACP methyl ester carboxylesterase [Palleronia aestuarii]|uniref:Pimeloyl-ACP methyl ester carboxylesterase n=1 Tax=Palleronia aestuarii TaxID=568105 RepID=A0A2W7N6T8_9RHOB|nr:alpha/beta fold hydrolase [Palleronia aestuarii]PZX15780.1 pimeloyl-ACP methyl ester carboxylesterase [Palleronia aestuarii]